MYYSICSVYECLKSSTSTSRVFVNKTFGLTKDVPTTKANATRIAQPVFIFAISSGGRCLLFTNVEIIPVRCAVGSGVPLSDAQRILSRSVSRPTAGGQALFSSAPRLRWRRHNRYNSSYRSVLLKDTHWDALQHAWQFTKHTLCSFHISILEIKTTCSSN